MKEEAPTWFYFLAFGLLPGSLLLIWIVTSVSPTSDLSGWVAKNITGIFIAAGVATGFLLWYGAENYA